MERPHSIVRFETTAYLALALSIGSSIINTRPAPLFSGVAILTFLFQVLFIWLIARKRKNWARWVWIAVIGFGTVGAVVAKIRYPLSTQGIAGTAAFYLVYIVSLVSAYFLLTRDAFAWFRGQTADLNAFD